MKAILQDTYVPQVFASRGIPLSVPEFTGKEWKYVKECLKTGWVSSAGPFVKKFEERSAEYVGCQYAVSCSSGTAALHTALLVLGIQPDEEVIVPDLTFAAPGFAVRYVGAWPLFIDVEKNYFQMDPQKLKDFLEKECRFKNGKCVNRKTGRRISAILPVHLLGHPVEMAPVMALAKHYGLWVIEDVAESLGARYRGKRAGMFGDIAVLSFNGNKVITCGGGGMLLTDSKALAGKAEYLTTQAKDDPLEYIHNQVGYNYRLNNLQAAVGLAQFEKLEQYLKKKVTIAKNYAEALAEVRALTLPRQAPWASSIWWLYTVLVNPKTYGMNARSLMEVLRRHNIQARPFWHPLHSLKAFEGCAAYQIEQSIKLYQQGLSLPSSVGMSKADQDRVITVIRSTASR